MKKRESFGSPFFMGHVLRGGVDCQVLATPCSAPVRSSAARAALRGQARSYVCFGPVRSVAIARGRLGACLQMGVGCQMLTATCFAPVRSSAARAALRGQARSYACFGPVCPVAIARGRLDACLDIAPYKQGGRARLAQAILARNKRRSGLAREAPRGRRSISQALKMA